MENNKYKELNLSSELRRGIEDMGFEELSPIQRDAIPHMLDGRDIIGQAQTGTGKTAAFGIPMLEKIDTGNKNVQQIVLCPTRELSIQVAKEITNLGKYKKSLRILPIYGGQPINRQIKALKRGVQIVVATPGRMIDHINRGTLRLDNIDTIVLDEADEMFDMGFRDDIRLVMDRIPRGNDRQTIFFSATMPREIINFAKRYQDNPELVKVAHKELTMPNIDQYYLNVSEHQKTEIVSRLIDIDNPRLAIVFANTKRKVDNLKDSLESRGYLVDKLHGDLNQNQRDRVMDKFRKGKIDILVATDVAARGLDVDEVDLVFNYDLPQDEEYYVHRIGRTARAGRKGISYSFVTKKDRKSLRAIERYAKTKIEYRNIPTMEEIEDSREEILIDEIHEILEKGENKKYNNLLNNILELGYGPYEVAASVLKLYVDSKSSNIEDIDTRNNKSLSKNGKSTKKMDKNKISRIYISTGRKKGVAPRHILAAIIEEANIDKDMVGSIDIFDTFTFVDIDKSVADLVIKNLNNKKIKNHTVVVERANKSK